MSWYGSTLESPCGPLGLVVDERGAVLRVEFVGGRDAARFRRALAARGDTLIEAPERTRSLALQLGEYFAGTRRSFDLELAFTGTPFQLLVWRALTAIPYGETMSYRNLAAAIGDPAAVRAVGTANGANPIAIVVPCHRVIGADGSLTGYGGGLENKQLLLELEGWRGGEKQLSLI